MDVMQIANYMVSANTALARNDAVIGMAKKNIEATKSIVEMIGEVGNLSAKGRGQVINITV